MSKVVENKKREAVQASLFSSSKLVPGLPAPIQRKRLICLRWRQMISDLLQGKELWPNSLAFDLNEEQLAELRKAWDETREEFSQQSELRSLQTEEVRKYVKASNDLKLRLTRLHQRWHSVKYYENLDPSDRRVALKRIRFEHKVAALEIKKIMRMAKAVQQDFDEIRFPTKGRYRWAAELIPDGAMFNWPKEVRYRRIITLYQAWLAKTENEIVEYFVAMNEAFEDE